METQTDFVMVPPDELVERWGQGVRVLECLPEHERERHWDMGVWGRVTACGTIACAAGHCGQDPWFRERGFKLDFIDDSAEISDVEAFFGSEGAQRIFMNSKPRPVETVIEEMRAHHTELQRIAAHMARPDLPNVGEPWPGQGGIYAGALLSADGSAYYLIVGPESEDSLSFGAANDWAAALEVDGHRDFVMPTRTEQRAEWDRVRALFEEERYWSGWYWSGEQHESDSHDAWLQDFLYGNQGYWSKGSKLRARAVRRLVIQ